MVERVPYRNARAQTNTAVYGMPAMKMCAIKITFTEIDFRAGLFQCVWSVLIAGHFYEFQLSDETLNLPGQALRGHSMTFVSRQYKVVLRHF